MSNSEIQNYEMVYKKHFIDDKNSHLRTSQPDDDLDSSEQYKEVFLSAKGYLKREKLNPKENQTFPIYNSLDAIIHTNKKEGFANTWDGLGSAFLLFTWYTLQLLHAPWRKSFLKIKTYNGHFQHRVYGNFPPSVAEHLMERMGYIYHEPDQAFVFDRKTWPAGTWRDALARVAMDFFLVHVYCIVASARSNAVTLSTLKPAKIREESSPKSKLKKEVFKPGKFGSDIKEESVFPTEEFDKGFEKLKLNHYATMDEMRLHSRPRDVNTSSSRLLQRRLQSESREFNDVDAYSGVDLVDAKIRYPPQKAGPKSGRKEVTSKSRLSTNNYVQVQPMSQFLGLTPRSDRVESGYYSEWALNNLALENKNQAPSRDPVYTLLSKRPPGDGEPTASFRTYHEIPDPSRGEPSRSLGQ